jgi:hypothetical protein
LNLSARQLEVREIMEREQQDIPSGQIPPLANDEWFLRLHFSPEHFLNGELVSAAISTSDLRERGFSVDRESIVDPGIIQDRAVIQQQKVPEKREIPYLSRFKYISICLIKYEKKDAFEVIVSPTNENPAHAHILSAQQLGNGGLKKLRILLLKELQTLIALDQYITDRQTTN